MKFRPKIQHRKIIRQIGDILTALDERKYGDVEEEMFRRGYRNPSRKEMLIYYFVGDGIFKQLIQTTYRYTELEAEYLGIPFTDEKHQFKMMNLVNLEQMCDNMISQLPKLQDIKREDIRWVPVSEREMKQSIIRKYHASKPKLLDSK